MVDAQFEPEKEQSGGVGSTFSVPGLDCDFGVHPSRNSLRAVANHFHGRARFDAQSIDSALQLLPNNDCFPQLIGTAASRLRLGSEIYAPGGDGSDLGGVAHWQDAVGGKDDALALLNRELGNREQRVEFFRIDITLDEIRERLSAGKIGIANLDLLTLGRGVDVGSNTVEQLDSRLGLSREFESNPLMPVALPLIAFNDTGLIIHTIERPQLWVPDHIFEESRHAPGMDQCVVFVYGPNAGIAEEFDLLGFQIVQFAEGPRVTFRDVDWNQISEEWMGWNSWRPLPDRFFEYYHKSVVDFAREDELGEIAEPRHYLTDTGEPDIDLICSDLRTNYSASYGQLFLAVPNPRRLPDAQRDDFLEAALDRIDILLARQVPEYVMEYIDKLLLFWFDDLEPLKERLPKFFDEKYLQHIPPFPKPDRSQRKESDVNIGAREIRDILYQQFPDEHGEVAELVAQMCDFPNLFLEWQALHREVRFRRSLPLKTPHEQSWASDKRGVGVVLSDKPTTAVILTGRASNVAFTLSPEDALECFYLLRPTETLKVIEKMEPESVRQQFREALRGKIVGEWSTSAYFTHYQDSLDALAQMDEFGDLEEIVKRQKVSEEVTAKAIAKAPENSRAARDWAIELMDSEDPKVRREVSTAIAKFGLVAELRTLARDKDYEVATTAIAAMGKQPKSDDVAGFLRTLRGENMNCSDPRDADDVRRYKVAVRASLYRAMGNQEMFQDLWEYRTDIMDQDPLLQIIMAFGTPLAARFQEADESGWPSELATLKTNVVEWLTEHTTNRYRHHEPVYATHSLGDLNERDVLKELITNENWEIAQAAFDILYADGEILEEDAGPAVQRFFRQTSGFPQFYTLTPTFVNLGDPRFLVDVIEADKGEDMQTSDLYRAHYVETLAKFPEHREYVLSKLAEFRSDKSDRVQSALVEAYVALGEWDLAMDMRYCGSAPALNTLAKCISESDLEGDQKRELLVVLRKGMESDYAKLRLTEYDKGNFLIGLSKAAARSLEDRDGAIRIAQAPENAGQFLELPDNRDSMFRQ